MEDNNNNVLEQNVPNIDPVPETKSTNRIMKTMTSVIDQMIWVIDEMVWIINQIIIRNLLSKKGLIVSFSIVVLLIAYLIDDPTPVSCDMKIAENRDFNHFYGITGLKNHFTTPTADDCNSNIIFRSALPQSILKPDNSASSFLTLAKFGTGKTLLRCEYYKSLPSNNYLKILILNKQINEYLDRFISGIVPNQNENNLLKWSDNEFIQLILSSLVTEFINSCQNKRVELSSLSLEEKIDLITIICYYYNGLGTSELEYFINSFLGKQPQLMYRASLAQPQIKERNLFHDKPLFIHLKNDLNKFTVLKKDYERLHLLLAILEGEDFVLRASTKTLRGNVSRDLTQFSLFIKNYLKKQPVFILDGIDENGHFFQKKLVNKPSLELFYRSSVSQEILSMVMANHFYLSIFYPKIGDINIQDAIIRKDKFPTHTITWNIKSLSNYADYVLQEMNKNANQTRCTQFTDFKTLVNISNRKIADIIEKIPTPRALHYFMAALIREMNNDANFVKDPFIATFENVHAAYEESYETFHERHKIKE